MPPINSPRDRALTRDPLRTARQKARIQVKTNKFKDMPNDSSAGRDEPAPGSQDMSLVQRVGALRIGGAVLIVVCLPMVFFTDVSGTGWGVIPVHVAPVIVLFLVWGLLFDMLMARVFMSAKEGAERARYKTVLVLDGGLILAIVIFWGPFFFALMARS